MINMFVIKYVVSELVWWLVVLVAMVGETRALQQLAAGEDNNILTAEEVLRSTTNTLFYLLRLRQAKERPRLQQYSLVHNYFITLTLQDYNSLREIAKLTRVDKENIGNIMTDFITLLNDTLDEEQVLKSKSLVNSIVGDEFDVHVELEKLEYLKKYHDPGYVTDINSEILKQLYKITKTVEIQPYNTSTTTESPLLDPNQILTGDVTGNILKLLEDNYFRLDFDGTDTLRTVESSMYLHNDTIPHEKALWRVDDVFPSGRRIFNGKKTKIKHFPFMASVQIFNKFQCAGSIIKNDLVVTAASCLQLAWNNRLYRENPSFLTVRIGSSFYEGGGENIPVMEIYFYPAYNPRNLHNNLAIMRLFRKIKWHRNVKKIALDTEEHTLPDNTEEVIVVGWGARSASNIMHNAFTDKLQYSILSYYPLRDCQEIYSSEYVTLKNFCAGYISFGSGACNRDVGGPGIISGMLAGVISFGAPVCGTPDAPTVFTKIGFYYDWIEEIMEQDVPSTKVKITLKPAPNTKTGSPDHKTEWTFQPVQFATKLELEPLGMAQNNSIREDDDDDDNKDESSAEDQGDMKNLLNKIFTDSNELKAYLVEVNRTREELLQMANTNVSYDDNDKQEEYKGPIKATLLNPNPTEIITSTDSSDEIILHTSKLLKLKNLDLKDVSRASDVKSDEEEVNDANRQLIKHYKKLIRDIEKKLPPKFLESQKNGKFPNVKNKNITSIKTSKSSSSSASKVAKSTTPKLKQKHVPQENKKIKHKTHSKASKGNSPTSSEITESTPNLKQNHVNENNKNQIKMHKHHSNKTKGTTKAKEKKHKQDTKNSKMHIPADIVEEKKVENESDSDNYESQSEEVFILELPVTIPDRSPNKERNTTTKKEQKITKKAIPSTSKAVKTTTHKKHEEKKVPTTPKPSGKKKSIIEPKIIIKNKIPLKIIKNPLKIEKNFSRILPDGETSYDDLDFPKMSPKTDSIETLTNETHTMTQNDTIYEDYGEIAPNLKGELERLKNNIKHLISDAETSQEDDGFKALMIEANDTQTIERVFMSNENENAQDTPEIINNSTDLKYIIRQGTFNNETNYVSLSTTPKIKKFILKHKSPKHKKRIKIEVKEIPEKRTTPNYEKATGNESVDEDLSAPRQENVPKGMDDNVSSTQTKNKSSTSNKKEEEIQQMMETKRQEKEIKDRAQPSPDSNTSDDIILAKSSSVESEEKNILNYINIK